MQTLSHESIYNLYKSCCALHKEAEKIGLKFSMNFYGFYKLQEKHKRKEESYCIRAPETFQNFTVMPSGTKSLTNKSSAAEASSPPVMWDQSWQTNEPGLRLGSPSTYWWWWLGRRRRRRAKAVRPWVLEFG
jgi:hypothetical protein